MNQNKEKNTKNTTKRGFNQTSNFQHLTSNKGITLVALVITIIVLLILAVVAIRAIQNDSIIDYAKNSVDEYERAYANEQSLLQGYIEKIEENLPNSGGMSKADIAELELMERYALGAEKTGRSALEIANVNMETMTITSFKDEESTIADASTTVTCMCMANAEVNTKRKRICKI